MTDDTNVAIAWIELGRRVEASPELTKLYERVIAGIIWLGEHDPTGAFHVWFSANISPHSTMPAQSEDRRAEYRAYHENRTRWEALLKRMEARERAEAKEAAKSESA